MLGLMKAEIPTFVLHEDLVNGRVFTDRYFLTENLVYQYLDCTNVSISNRVQTLLKVPLESRNIRAPCRQIAEDSGRLAIPRLDKLKTAGQVSSGWVDWTFNLKTRTWHYDASASIEQPYEGYYRFTPTPLPEGPLPQLDADEITTYFENTFGDFVYLIASLGYTVQVDLSGMAHYDQLTFGAVIDLFASEILAHFPSTPRPEWCFENRSYNIDAGYSEKGVPESHPNPPLLTSLVPSRVDLTFHDTHNTQLNLYFSSRLPLKDRTRLRAAYLCQSDKDSYLSTYFIDEIGFSVTGHFSRDPKGKTVISEKDWEQSGIPELEVETCVGSYWEDEEYNLVESHLHTKNYDIDGKQYAQDHGYPELIWVFGSGDPYARRIVELKNTGSNEDLEDSNQHGDSEELDEFCSSISQPAYPSTSLFVDTSAGCALAHTGDQDNRHEASAQKSVEETRRIRGQHATVQETKCQSDSSKPITQKSAPLEHSPTFMSYTATKRAKRPQGTTRVKIDARDETSAHATRPPAQGKAAAISKSQIQPKRTAHKSFETMTSGVGAGQTFTAAQCSLTIVSELATKRPKPSDQGTESLGGDSRDYTPVRPTRLEARGKTVVMSSPQTRPKTVEQQSLGTKAAGVSAREKPVPARRTRTAGKVITTSNRPKEQSKQEVPKVTPAKPTPSSARTTRSQTTRTNETVKKAWR
ncbi:hypothetical protein PM082_019797 [Marasmius tenuissimus]|nr:hypothetical protein PM082_019797 [Marasmius tenuissimus]